GTARTGEISSDGLRSRPRARSASTTGSGASPCSPTTRSSSRSSSTRCVSTRRARATRSSGRSTWASGSRRRSSPRSCARESAAPTDPGQLAALAALVLAAAVLYSSVGAGFGLLAGLTGIGGGIFLSPTLILAGWETPRRTAGASVTFILANSVAGLLGHLSTAGGVPPGTALLAAVALAGGLWGSWLGAHRLPPLAIRRLLAVVLVVAGVKLLLSA